MLKKYQYQIVAYDEVKLRADGNGYFYTKPCDVIIISTNEDEALQESKTVVKRANYEVFRVEVIP